MNKSHLWALFLSMLVLFVLAGCASAPETGDGPEPMGADEAAASAAQQTRDGFTDAALSPFEDLNLRREAIPQTLRALETPYSDAVNMSCSQIVEAVIALDRELGRDWDTPAPENEETEENRAQWAADESADFALDTVSSEARSFIPFRGLVREATGAEAYSRRVQKAYRIGAERRAFLKGVGLARGCLPPAAPWPRAETDETIVYRTHEGQRR